MCSLLITVFSYYYFYIWNFDRKFATFSASSELPLNVEDALIFWLNKCQAKFNHSFAQQRSTVGNKDTLVTSVHDIGDGRCLASAISFYRPNDLSPDG